MKSPASASWKAPLKFRMPTAENLIPIRLDIEVDGQPYKDAFTWNPYDPDSEVVMFAKRTVKDLKLAPGFLPQIVQSIQSQLATFQSYEGQDMYVGDLIIPIKLDLQVNHTVIRDQFLWDLNNFDSDPEEFARTLCKDLGIEDPEVEPAIAFAIREQLYEIAIQNVTTARENRISKKGRRAAEHFTPSKASGAALDLMKLFSFRSSVVRKRKDWDYYKPVLDLLSNEDVDALKAKEERSGWLDIEVDGQCYKDVFTWKPYDPDSEVVMFAKKDCKRLEACQRTTILYINLLLYPLPLLGSVGSSFTLSDRSRFLSLYMSPIFEICGFIFYMVSAAFVCCCWFFLFNHE
ncbi:chromatin structure-remodeling complex protein BSH isoform X5 [Gossypium hirsutum]|uniref:Chromatin structure-remodeling complex protein BSH-like isoform X1 n=5 Tax=Gossypium TaxID=3633 RepID=A0A1U8I1H9_GOSHI|nr:chromatin structure-remodeling complex protein BSH-like isoform X5 [Gossypium hirsutum]XP_016666492.1 chromatin structure-remodeling complex protein BSH-like isoform X5 [Gossypium hirsutum]